MKADKSIEEVWKWKENVYDEMKSFSTKEKIASFRKSSEDFSGYNPRGIVYVPSSTSEPYVTSYFYALCADGNIYQLKFPRIGNNGANWDGYGFLQE